MASAHPTAYPRNASLIEDTIAASEGQEHPPSDVDNALFVLPANNLLTVIGRDGCFKRLEWRCVHASRPRVSAEAALEPQHRYQKVAQM